MESLKSFYDYDFDGDGKWQTYISNVEVVGYGSKSDDEQLQNRLKAKWYKKNIDPEFNVSDVTASTTGDAAAGEAPAAPPASTAEPTPSTPAPAQTPEPRTSQARTTSTSGIASDITQEALKSGVSNLVHGLMWVAFVAFAVTYVLRMGMYNAWSYRAYMSLMLTAHFTRLSNQVGMPKLRPFSWQVLQDWTSRITDTSDWHYGMVAFIFMGQRPCLPIMISPLMLASLRLASYLKRHFSGRIPALGAPCAWVLSQREAAFEMMAMMDISVLILLIIQAFTHQARLLPFIYLSTLRARYSSPVSARYHRPIWQKLGAHVSPYLGRAPSVVQQVVGFAVKWFTSARAS